MHLVFTVAGFYWAKEDDMPSTLIPTRVPAGSASQMGRFPGGLSVRTISGEAAPRKRATAIPVKTAHASPAVAVHPADAAQHPSCLYHE